MLPLGKQRFLPAPGFPQEASNDPTECYIVWQDQRSSCSLDCNMWSPSLRSIPCHSMLGTFGRTFLQSARSERFELFTVTLHGRPRFILWTCTLRWAFALVTPSSSPKKIGRRELGHVHRMTDPRREGRTHLLGDQTIFRPSQGRVRFGHHSRRLSQEEFASMTRKELSLLPTSAETRRILGRKDRKSEDLSGLVHPFCVPSFLWAQGGTPQGVLFGLLRILCGPSDDERRRAAGRRERPREVNHPVVSHSGIDYERFNSNSVSIRCWSWNYRSCWHQTCLPVDPHCCFWIQHPSQTPLTRMGVWRYYFSSLSRQFVLALDNLRACCLP